jgi:DNA-binding NtrC family response regulator
MDALSDAVITRLVDHRWPGNVRELENTIERAVVLAPGRAITSDLITMDMSDRALITGVPSLRLRENIAWIERETVRRAMAVSSAKQAAARLMGITPRALSHYLAKYRELAARES